MLVISVIVIGAFAIEMAKVWWRQTEWRRARIRRRRHEEVSLIQGAHR